jgi:aminoglycoside phosphotransferase (APT) family kinase protein
MYANEATFARPDGAACPIAAAPPGCPDNVAQALLGYLGRRLDDDEIDYAARPTAIADGWETYLYHFQLKGPHLPAAWQQPLTLRIHADRAGVERARHEFTVAQHLVRLGYPVPAVLLLEERPALFGGPFLVMRQVVGAPLLRAMLAAPWKIFNFPAQMAATHVALHDLPADGFPTAPGSFLQRRLEGLACSIDEHDLAALRPALAWLWQHQPAPPSQLSILHLDFHPLNLIYRPDGSLAVLDWTYAAVGDADADVATTLMFFEAIPLAPRNPWEWLAIPIGRPIQCWSYLHAYRRRRPLDDHKLAYYRACAALNHLVRYSRWLTAGPKACDCKPVSRERIDLKLMAALGRYFERWTGVRVKL